MTRSRCTRTRVIGAALLALSSTAAARAPVWIWYRSSEGCPDGEAFVTRLNGLGQSAQLAGVGDRVDFVVTLGRERDESSGRLERETRGGTVAIREYRDADCAQVAEALALTLELALDPNALPAAEAASPEAARDRAREPSPAVHERSSRDFSATDAPAQPAALEGGTSPTTAAVGAQATLASGVAPELLTGAAVFLNLHGSGGLPRSARLTLLGGHSESATSSRTLAVSLLGVRAEACPLSWSEVPELVVKPCAGAEAGFIRGAGGDPAGSADHGFWGTVVAHGRVALRAFGPLRLEAQVGARVPLVRYEMGTRDGSADWFRTRAVGLDVGVGASWQIW